MCLVRVVETMSVGEITLHYKSLALFTAMLPATAAAATAAVADTPTPTPTPATTVLLLH